MSTTSSSALTDGVTVIHRELVQVEADLAIVTDPQVAGTLELRRQALEAQRLVAHAREQAVHRRQQAEQARKDRDAFAVLEADVTADLRTQAAQLDAWVREGAELVTQYRALARRLGDVEAVLVPAAPGRELHLHGSLDRIRTIDTELEESLARATVLGHISLNAFARDVTQTLETYVAGQVRRFFDQARQRLAPVDTADVTVAGASSQEPVPAAPDETEAPGIA